MAPSLAEFGVLESSGYSVGEKSPSWTHWLGDVKGAWANYLIRIILSILMMNCVISHVVISSLAT